MTYHMVSHIIFFGYEPYGPHLKWILVDKHNIDITCSLAQVEWCSSWDFSANISVFQVYVKHFVTVLLDSIYLGCLLIT
jgi:hypothetical protein